jgi:hypothetical protein
MHSALTLIVNDYRKNHPQLPARRECCICNVSHKNKYAHCLNALGLFVVEFFDAALDGVDKYGVGNICGRCVYSLSNALFYRFDFQIPYNLRDDLSVEQKKDAEFLIIEWMAKQIQKTSKKLIQPEKESRSLN